MNTYLGTLKKGISYDHSLQLRLEKNNIIVIKHLATLNVLIIQAEEELTPKDHPYFESLEKERNDFSI